MVDLARRGVRSLRHAAAAAAGMAAGMASVQAEAQALAQAPQVMVRHMLGRPAVGLQLLAVPTPPARWLLHPPVS